MVCENEWNGVRWYAVTFSSKPISLHTTSFLFWKCLPLSWKSTFYFIFA